MECSTAGNCHFLKLYMLPFVTDMLERWQVMFWNLCVVLKAPKLLERVETTCENQLVMCTNTGKHDPFNGSRWSPNLEIVTQPKWHEPVRVYGLTKWKILTFCFDQGIQMKPCHHTAMVPWKTNKQASKQFSCKIWTSILQTFGGSVRINCAWFKVKRSIHFGISPKSQRKEWVIIRLSWVTLGHGFHFIFAGFKVDLHG